MDVTLAALRASLAGALRAMAVILVLLSATATAAQEARTFVKKGAYDDVRLDLNEAVIGKGLKVEHTGDIAGMLERTGADVGSTKPIYTKAEYFLVCSALLSRRAMEADPANIAACPYVLFLYETVDRPGEVVIGYRRPAGAGGQPQGGANPAISAIEALLEDIVREAIR